MMIGVRALRPHLLREVEYLYSNNTTTPFFSFFLLFFFYSFFMHFSYV